MGDKEAKEAQDKALVAELDSMLVSLWNSTVDMDDVATECKFQKGESLYDRIGKCEKSLGEWEKDLAELQRSLASLKKALDGYPTKYGNEVPHAAELSYDLAVRQSDEMRATLKKARDTLAQHKAALRKVKA